MSSEEINLGTPKNLRKMERFSKKKKWKREKFWWIEVGCMIFGTIILSLSFIFLITKFYIFHQPSDAVHHPNLT